MFLILLTQFCCVSNLIIQNYGNTRFITIKNFAYNFVYNTTLKYKHAYF